MIFDRETWLPLAKRIYDDNSFNWEFSRREDGSRVELHERPEGIQNSYLERALEYAALVPDAADPLVLLGLKSELNRVMDESEELLGQVARVREERDELAKKVARVVDHIDMLGMDRENWNRASRLQDILDGK